MASADPTCLLNPDVTLICHGDRSKGEEEFDVHLATLRSQSSYFRKQFIGLRRGEIEVQKFEPDTVARVLNYLYYRNHSFTTNTYNFSALPDAVDAAADGDGDEAAIQQEVFALDEVLMAHLRVHAVADDWDIPRLKILSRDTFMDLLDLFPEYASGIRDLAEVISTIYSAKSAMKGVKAALMSACLRDADPHDESFKSS